MTLYIQDTAHYTEVITRMAQAKRLLRPMRSQRFLWR